MNIFHIFTVSPVDVDRHELAAVQYGYYYVAAESLEKAFHSLRECGDVIRASEVYGGQMFTLHGEGVIVRPDSRLTVRKDMADHLHWASVQDRYKLLATGPESLTQYRDRKSSEWWPVAQADVAGG